MSKASLETLARTMSVSLLVIAVIAVGQEQTKPAAAMSPDKKEIVAASTIKIQTHKKTVTRTEKVSRNKLKSFVLASRRPAPKSVAARGKWLKSLLYEAGFRGKHLRQAWAVAMKESTGRPKAYNGNLATGDHSYGIFQINMLGNLGYERRALFGIKTNNALYDPLTNAKAAYYMSNHGTDWSSWDIDASGYNGGVSKTRYQYWLTQYPEG